MDILITIGQYIVAVFFILAFIVGLIACVELAKFDVRGTKSANKNNSEKDDNIKIEITIKYFNEAKKIEYSPKSTGLWMWL